jgi:hypothetical protein
MGQCQLMLEDNEKNNLKNSIPLKFEDMGAQNIKRDFDYLFFTSQWHNNSERL